ncbi:hypothetical protein NHH03_14205 [Stieleria sp. TO1_6]|nr:hypothetical protein [Stieleria tagensis]
MKMLLFDGGAESRFRIWQGCVAPLICGFLLSLSQGSALAQTAVELDTSDFKGIELDLDQSPLMPIFTEDADVFYRATFAGDSENRVGAALSEHSLQGLNADGIFAAEYRVRVDRKAQDPAGSRNVAVNFYEADGVIGAADISNPAVRDPQRTYPEFSYNSASGTGVDVSLSVGAELRETINRGASHIGATVQSTFPQGTSQILSSAPPIIEVTEYYEDPFDALPLFSGSTGLVYRGHANETVTQGESVVVGDDIARFRVFLRGDNSIDVLIDETGMPGNFYAVTVESDDGSLLQIGDSFQARRSPFQPPGFAGFDFSAKGRGLNELMAEFTVNDIAYDGLGGVERLDISFSQNAYISANDTTPFGTPKAFGRLRINATAVPEPATFAGLAVILVTASIPRRRRKRTSPI